MAKVAVLGGGVAGLSAAQELIARGFDVEVYETGAVFGGKARSINKPSSGTGGREDLPGEHGFRFFPGFYQHVIDTMARIPAGASSATVADNLVPTEFVGIARKGMPLFRMPLETPTTLAQWIEALKVWFANPDLGVPTDEAIFFVGKMLQFMTSCNERRFGQYEFKKWWEYVEAETKSDAYKNLIARGLTRSLVAMRAEEASTRTVATILSQMLFSISNSTGPATDRVLNAPTNTAWILPWRDCLASRGVVFFPQSEVKELRLDVDRISAVKVQTGTGMIDVIADYYVCAVPVEVMRVLATPAILEAAPSLSGLEELKTEWMNGIQFFLNRDVPITGGHVILAQSTWALTLLSQPQFWPGINLSGFGDGTVKGIISVDISDWDTAGSELVFKTAKQCTEAEIRKEVWAQIKVHLQSAGLQDSDIVDCFLDPAIVVGSPTTNSSPLLVNTIGSWPCRPKAATEISNLFLASDYVQTETDLATMEGANEAARHAVNGILLSAGATGIPPCSTWKLREPPVFDTAKTIDRVLWFLGLPHPGPQIMSWIFGGGL